MPFADSQGIRIHYEVDGQGPPVLLHHGLGGSLQAWHQLGYAAALRADYRLIMLDARGHGVSDKPHDPTAYGLSRHVVDVLAVLEALHLSKAHFFGYSMGGWIGFGLATYAPARVDSLIIGGAHPYADSSYVQAFAGLDATDPEAFLAAFEEVIAEPLPREVKPRILANDLRALTAAANQDRASLAEALPTMPMPCLLLAGEADCRRAQIERCAKDIPQATLVTLPGLGHVATIVRSDLVLPHVRRFFAAQGRTEG